MTTPSIMEATIHVTDGGLIEVRSALEAMGYSGNLTDEGEVEAVLELAAAALTLAAAATSKTNLHMMAAACADVAMTCIK